MITNDIYKLQSFGGQLGYGRSMGLLNIDLQQGFADPTAFGGFNICTAIAQTVRLLDGARAAAIPIAHVMFQVQEGGTNLGPFGLKVPSLLNMTADAPNAQIVPELTPIKGEYVATKQHASAFFGTSLAAWLLMKRVDTLLIAGCTTSGCIRASVVDASAHGLRPMVVEECVGDRAEEPHRANLFDMEQKYADIVSLTDVLARLGGVPA
jgi:maleamate amidohydrolase